MNQSNFSQLVKSANGVKVFAPYDKEYPIDWLILRKAIKMTNIVEDVEQYEVDMKFETGFERCIRTTAGRIGQVPSRGRKLIICDDLPVKTTLLTLVVKKGKRRNIQIN